MSWSTLILGYFEFLPTTTKAIRKAFLEKAHEVLECIPEQYPDNPLKYKVESLNFSSHVVDTNIQQFYDEFEQYFNYISLSFWDLSEADRDWYKEL